MAVATARNGTARGDSSGGAQIAAAISERREDGKEALGDVSATPAAKVTPGRRRPAHGRARLRRAQNVPPARLTYRLEGMVVLSLTRLNSKVMVLVLKARRPVCGSNSKDCAIDLPLGPLSTTESAFSSLP